MRYYICLYKKSLNSKDHYLFRICVKKLSILYLLLQYEQQYQYKHFICKFFSKAMQTMILFQMNITDRMIQSQSSRNLNFQQV